MHISIRRTITTAIAAGALTVGLAACGDDKPKTLPSVSPSPTSQAPSPSPTTDAWKAKYTPAQLKAYDAALQRWNDYESRSEAIWAKGQATPQAEKLFQAYFPNPAWKTYLRQLQTYQKVEVKVTGTPKIFWSRAKSISKNGDSVAIDQCIDLTSERTTQWGKATQRSPWMDKPQMRTITLSKPAGYDWLIYSAEKTPGTGEYKDRQCDPNS